MSSSVPMPPPGFEGLSVQEKIEYIQALWDDVATADDVELTDAHREIIRQRLAEHRADPRQGRPWSEVRRDIERKLAERFGDR